MNLTYIKDYLQQRKDSITTKDIEVLISEINAYQGTEGTFKDISKVMRVVNDYNISFLTAVSEYEVLPKNDINLFPKRMEKAREVLCTLSALHTYLVLSISTIKDSTYAMGNIKQYMRDLSDKKEHFKSEKMAWITILKSLTQEASFLVEMRKMDIEDKLGYFRSGGKNG